MWKLFLFGIVVIAFIPLVMKGLDKGYNWLTSDDEEKKKNASDVIKGIKDEQSRLEKEAKQREAEAKEAKEQEDKLNAFLGGYHADGEEKAKEDK